MTRRARHLGAVVGAVVVAVLVAGCGSVTKTTSTTRSTRPPQTSTAPTQPPTAPTQPTTAPTTQPPHTPPPTVEAGASVGTVIEVDPTGGTVGGTNAFEGQNVKARSIIATSPGGKVGFALPDLVPFCRVELASQAKVRPDEVTLVEVTQGTLLCQTAGNSALKTFKGPNTRIIAKDPVFVLHVGTEGLEVSVAQGFVKVEGPKGTVVLGANQQSIAGSEAISWSPDRLEPDAGSAVTTRASEAIGRIRVAYPNLPANLLPTSPVSPRTLTVDVRSDDDRVRNLAVSLLKVFANHIAGGQVHIEPAPPGGSAPPSTEPPTTATTTSSASTTSTTVAPSPGPPRPSQAPATPDLVVSSNSKNGVPLFELDGPWYVTVGHGQPAVLAPLASFLETALQATCSTASNADAATPGRSCYEEAYRSALGASSDKAVPLTIFAPLLGLA